MLKDAHGTAHGAALAGVAAGALLAAATDKGGGSGALACANTGTEEIPLGTPP